MKAAATVLLAEVAGVLAQRGRLRCAMTVEPVSDNQDSLLLTIEVPSDAGFEVVELWEGLRYVHDVGTIRAFATRYDIDPAALEAIILKRQP